VIISAVRIETPRLVLRIPSEDDVDAWAAAVTDPEVMRHIGSGAVGTRDGSSAAIARYRRFWELDGFGMFALERREAGVVVGRAGLLARDPEDDWNQGSQAELGPGAEVEIGWLLARRFWGYGYATEAALSVRDWAFGELQFGRLVSLIAPANGRSIRVAEKLGAHHARDVIRGTGQVTCLYVIDTHRRLPR
jgi:RimJ/RimL family protein N-acetyltransferase